MGIFLRRGSYINKKPSMKKIKGKFSYGALGALSSLAGLPSITRCNGGNCATCFGYAGIGLVLLFMVLLREFTRNKEGVDGTAKGID